MKVNKKILAILMMGGMLVSVGCSSNNSSNESSINSNTTIETEIENSNPKYSKEELVVKYEELLPEIKQVFNNYQLSYITYEELVSQIAQQAENEELLAETEIDSDYVDGMFDNMKGILLDDKNSQKEDVLNASFNVYDGDKYENLIYFSAMININLDDIKDTFLGDITKAISNKNNSTKIDYDKINNDINEVFEKGDSSNTTNVYNYENLEISIDIYSNYAIGYSIKIK